MTFPGVRAIEFFLCHGSGNTFVMIDAVCEGTPLAGVDFGALARQLCAPAGDMRRDGLLLLVREGGRYGMRMFNPDGTPAGMCGNGIRCVARLAASRYLRAERFALFSGGRTYDIVRGAELAPGVGAWGVRIPVGTRRDDLRLPYDAGGRFVGRTIPALDDVLCFTALDPGNPHLVARTERIDYALLRRLGERAACLSDLFPRGVNVSFWRPCGPQAIFVATWERGAGLTASCGTAMTSSATAAYFLGDCRAGEPITVYNRGGMVRCRVEDGPEGIVTTLCGNATCTARGTFDLDAAGRVTGRRVTERYETETAAWECFAAGLAEYESIESKS